MAIIRVARLWAARPPSAPPGPAVPPSILAEGLDAFAPETVIPENAELGSAAGLVELPAKARGYRRAGLSALKWIVVVCFTATTAAASAWQYQRGASGAPTGSLTIETMPAGREVLIDGRPSGVTPLTLSLAPASYAIQLRSGAERRDLAVTVVAGTSIVRHIEFASAAPVAAPTGAVLVVETGLIGQSVVVDGVERGSSPLTVRGLAAGEHEVVVRGAAGAVRRTVALRDGETVSLVVLPVEPTVAAPGWLKVRSDTPLELREHGQVIGSTETDRIMLPAGRHVIEVVGDVIGYRASRSIDIVPGQTTTVGVDLPLGTISINALPWAEVWIDGERVGETPVANISRRLGAHEIVFRHPELGERRDTVLVTMGQPARLGVDMRGREQ